MSIVFLFVQVTTRNEEVKWCLKGLLGIAEEGVPAVPSRRSERTGGIDQAGKGHGDIFVLGMYQPLLVHWVLVGMILTLRLEGSDLGGEASHSLQVGFYIGLPLSLHPGGSALLDTPRRIYGEGGWTVCCGWIERIPTRIRGNAHIIHLMEWIVS